MSEDDKLDDRELTADEASLLSDEAFEPRSLDNDDDKDDRRELPTDDPLLSSEDALEFRSLDRLPPELLSLLELLEHAGTPKKMTPATNAPANAVTDLRTMKLQISA